MSAVVHGAACDLYRTGARSGDLSCACPVEEPHHRAARSLADDERVAIVRAHWDTPDGSPTDTPAG